MESFRKFIQNVLIKGLIFFATCTFLLCAYQVSLAFYYTKKISYTNVPFKRHIPDAALKILFVGDSTALGTGAQNNTESVAGWFGKDFPNASIDNVSKNGLKISELVESFHPEDFGYHNLIVVQIGGNDILQFTPLKNIERDLKVILERAKFVANHVVVLHTGNVGLAPIFSWPMNLIYTKRARDFRALYMRIAQEEQAHYINLFTERKDDIFLEDIDKYYAPDYLHPSGEGYKIWYKTIRKTLDKANISL